MKFDNIVKETPLIIGNVKMDENFDDDAVGSFIVHVARFNPKNWQDRNRRFLTRKDGRNKNTFANRKSSKIYRKEKYEE